MAITIDSLRSSIENKYTSSFIELDGETIVLRNPMRMSKEARKNLSKLAGAMSDGAEGEYGEDVEFDEDEMLSNLKDMLSIIIGDERQTQQLFVAMDGLGDDAFAAYSELVTEYNKAQKTGEASASAS